MKPKLLIALWFILLCAGTRYTYAQHTNWKPVIDSLSKKLAIAHNDTNKVYILADLSYRYFDIDTAKGGAYARQAFSLAQKLKWQPGIADAWCGLALNCGGDNAKSTAYVLKSIDISRRCNNRAGLKWAYCTLAYLYLVKNDNQNSLKYYSMGLKLNAPKARDVNANLSYGLGITFFNLRDTVKATEYFRHALGLFKEQKIKSYTANVLSSLGNAYLGKGQMEESRNYYQQCYDLFVEIKDKAGYANALWNIAATYLPTDIDKALRYYEEAIKFKRELKDYDSIGTIYAILGAHFANSSIETSEKYFLLARSAYQAAGSKSDAADMDWDMGYVYFNSDAGKAVAYLRLSLKAKEDLQNYGRAAQIAAKISDAYSRLGNADKAIDYYKLAANYYLKINDKASYSTALWALAALYQPVDADISISYYKQSAEIKKDLKDYANACSLMQNIGYYYMQRKEYGSALNYYQQALTLSFALHDHALIAGTISRVASVYQERDGTNKMIDYYTGLLADKKYDDAGRSDILYAFGTAYLALGNHPKALDYSLQALQIAEKQKAQPNMGHILQQIGNIYLQQMATSKALDYLSRSYKIYSANHQVVEMMNVMIDIGNCYSKAKNYEKAIAEYLEAEKLTGPFGKQTQEVILNNIADAYRNAGNYEKAVDYILQSMKIAEAIKDTGPALGFDLSTLAEINIAIAKDKTKPIPADTIFPKNRKALLEKAIAYLDRGMTFVDGNAISLITFFDDRAQANELLGNTGAAYADYKKYVSYRDSVFNQTKNQDITRRELQYQYGKQEDSLKYQQVITNGLLKQQTLLATQKEQQLALLSKEKDLELLNTQKTQAELLAEQNRRKANEQQLKASQKERAFAQTSLELQNIELKSKKAQSYYFMAGIAALLLLLVFIGLNYYNQRKSNQLLSAANLQIVTANKELDEQREEITTQRDRLSDTVEELKSTQKQLIQSEKMASLGELTAGIAHEIQNPLNFVNNFSELNREMLTDLREAVTAGDAEEVLAIISDLEQNEEKIYHHGKRADGIVKGMLEHSRASTGKKEPADLNKLIDEYLRLAYHGLRAKDKNFNVKLVTCFAEDLPPVNVISQEIGRVLLNLFNNAFYAVQQKQRSAETDYEPTVELSTCAINGQMQLTVKDNGPGIPNAIRDKILQPFFTTKPTGQGTGLGLSLSYDIIVKGHGGNIVIGPSTDEGATIIVLLPMIPQ